MSLRQENVKWVDVCVLPIFSRINRSFSIADIKQGLRGVASILVVFTHLARAFDDSLFRTHQYEGKPPRLVQQPFFRVLFQGRIGVAIFSLVTGYVCALKPIRHFHNGDHKVAFRGIAKGAFRRVPRLVLPTSIITCLIWVICELGGFKQAKRANGWWLNSMSPNKAPSFGFAVKSLFGALIDTWGKEHNPYDPNQWNLPPLLRGALQVYIMLIATSFCRTGYRMLISFILYLYFFASNDCESNAITTCISYTDCKQQLSSGCNSSLAYSLQISLSQRAIKIS